MHNKPIETLLEQVMNATVSPIVPSHLEPFVFTPTRSDMVSLGSAPIILQHARFRIGELQHHYETLCKDCASSDGNSCLYPMQRTLIMHQLNTLHSICSIKTAEIMIKAGQYDALDFALISSEWKVYGGTIGSLEIDNDFFSSDFKPTTVH